MRSQPQVQVPLHSQASALRPGATADLARLCPASLHSEAPAPGPSRTRRGDTGRPRHGCLAISVGPEMTRQPQKMPLGALLNVWPYKVSPEMARHPCLHIWGQTPQMWRHGCLAISLQQSLRIRKPQSPCPGAPAVSHPHRDPVCWGCSNPYSLRRGL